MEVVCHADRGEVFPPLTPNIVVILCTMFASLCSILLKGTATLMSHSIVDMQYQRAHTERTRTITEVIWSFYRC